jgi:hypothetical protein
MGDWRYIFVYILYLCTALRRMVNFIPSQLYPPRNKPGTHHIGCWVGPKRVIDTVVKRKIGVLPEMELVSSIP